MMCSIVVINVAGLSSASYTVVPLSKVANLRLFRVVCQCNVCSAGHSV